MFHVLLLSTRYDDSRRLIYTVEIDFSFPSIATSSVWKTQPSCRWATDEIRFRYSLFRNRLCAGNTPVRWRVTRCRRNVRSIATTPLTIRFLNTVPVTHGPRPYTNVRVERFDRHRFRFSANKPKTRWNGHKQTFPFFTSILGKTHFYEWRTRCSFVPRNNNVSRWRDTPLPLPYLIQHKRGAAIARNPNRPESCSVGDGMFSSRHVPILEVDDHTVEIIWSMEIFKNFFFYPM